VGARNRKLHVFDFYIIQIYRKTLRVRNIVENYFLLFVFDLLSENDPLLLLHVICSKINGRRKTQTKTRDYFAKMFCLRWKQSGEGLNMSSQSKILLDVGLGGGGRGRGRGRGREVRQPFDPFMGHPGQNILPSRPPPTCFASIYRFYIKKYRIFTDRLRQYKEMLVLYAMIGIAIVTRYSQRSTFLGQRIAYFVTSFKK
jgi:hypothetical protein